MGNKTSPRGSNSGKLSGKAIPPSHSALLSTLVQKTSRRTRIASRPISHSSVKKEEAASRCERGRRVLSSECRLSPRHRIAAEAKWARENLQNRFRGSIAHKRPRALSTDGEIGRTKSSPIRRDRRDIREIARQRSRKAGVLVGDEPAFLNGVRKNSTDLGNTGDGEHFIRRDGHPPASLGGRRGGWGGESAIIERAYKRSRHRVIPRLTTILARDGQPLDHLVHQRGAANGHGDTIQSPCHAASRAQSSSGGMKRSGSDLARGIPPFCKAPRCFTVLAAESPRTAGFLVCEMQSEFIGRSLISQA